MDIVIVDMNTTLNKVKKSLPELEKWLVETGYAPVVSIISIMAKPGKLPIGNIARAAGFTEIEIDLLVEGINGRIFDNSPVKRKKTTAKAKAKTKVETKAKKSKR